MRNADLWLWPTQKHHIHHNHYKDPRPPQAAHQVPGTTFSVYFKNKLMERNNDNAGSGVPENDSSKPMDSKREVEQSNDEKTDQDFPGYPHYPSKEDIMDQRTGSHKVDLDVENLASRRNATGVSQRFSAAA